MRKFNNKIYIKSKLDQLLDKAIKDKNGDDYTYESVASAIEDAGYTLQEHYQKYADKEGTSAYSHIKFDLNYYLNSKLAQLQLQNSKDSNGQAYTQETLLQAIHKAGLTAEQHYQQYSVQEGTSANPYFNTVEYLRAKLYQLQHSANVAERVEWAGKSVDDVAQAFIKAGLSAEEHYLRYGCKEVDQDGKFINPSNAFDANAYVAAKLAQLMATDPESWEGKTAQDVMEVIIKAGMTPVSHYERYGADEANASGIAMVQTVPVLDRVANDALRDVTGTNVPSNYNASTLAPKDVNHGIAVGKPADMGGLASTSISPAVISPEEPVATPQDVEYVAIPAQGIQDSNALPVELVVITVNDAQGQEVKVAQFGVTSTAANGSKITKAVGLDGKVASDASTIKVVTVDDDGNTVTVASVSDVAGNVLTEKIIESGRSSTINLSGKLMDGSVITSQATVISQASGAKTITKQTTITAKDESKVVIALQSTENGSEHSTTTTATSYDEQGVLTGRTTSEEHVSAAADGSVTTKIESTTWNSLGQATARSSSVSVESRDSDGAWSISSHGKEMDGNGKVIANIEVSDTLFRDAEGVLHENIVRTRSEVDSGKVITETTSSQEIVASDGSKTTTTNISVITRTSDGEDTTTSSEDIQKVFSDSQGNTVVETRHTETKSDGSQTITQTSSTTSSDGTTRTQGTVTEKDASGKTTKTETINEHESGNGTQNGSETSSQTSSNGSSQGTVKDNSGTTTETDSNPEHGSGNTSQNTGQGGNSGNTSTSDVNPALGMSKLQLSVVQVGDKTFDSSMNPSSLDDGAESLTLRIEGIGQDARSVTIALGDKKATFLVSVQGTSVHLTEQEGNSVCFTLQTQNATAAKDGTVACDVLFTRADDAADTASDSYKFEVSGKNASQGDLALEHSYLELATAKGEESDDLLGTSAISLSLEKINEAELGQNTDISAIDDSAKTFSFAISGIGKDVGMLSLSNGQEVFSFAVQHQGTAVTLTPLAGGSEKFSLEATAVQGKKDGTVSAHVIYTRSDSERDGSAADSHQFVVTAKDISGKAISVQGDTTLSLGTAMDELASSSLAFSLFAVDDTTCDASTKVSALPDSAKSFTFALTGLGKDAKKITISDGDDSLTFAVAVEGPTVTLTPDSQYSGKFSLQSQEIIGEKGETVTAFIKYDRSESESKCLSDDKYTFSLEGTDINNQKFTISTETLTLETRNNTSGSAELPLSNLSVGLVKVGDFAVNTMGGVDDTVDSFTLNISGLGRDVSEVTLSEGKEKFTFEVEVKGVNIVIKPIANSSDKFSFTQQTLEFSGTSSKTVDIDILYTRTDDEKSGQNVDNYDFKVEGKNAEGNHVSIKNENITFETNIDSTEVSEDWVVSNGNVVYQGGTLSSDDTVNIKMRSDGIIEVDNKYVENSVNTINLDNNYLSDSNIVISGKSSVGLGSGINPLTIKYGDNVPNSTSIFLTKNKEDNIVLQDIRSIGEAKEGDPDTFDVFGDLEYSANHPDIISGTFTFNDEFKVINGKISLSDADTLSIQSYVGETKLSGKLDKLGVSNLYMHKSLYSDITGLDTSSTKSLDTSVTKLNLLDSQLSSFTNIKSSVSDAEMHIMNEKNAYSKEVIFKDKVFNFSEYNGSVVTDSGAKFILEGNGTELKFNNAKMATLGTISLGDMNKSDDDNEIQKITLSKDILSHVKTINIDSDKDAVFLSSSVGDSSKSFLIEFSANNKGSLVLAAEEENSSAKHNYIKISEYVSMLMNIVAGDNGDTFIGSNGHNTFTLGNGSDIVKSNVSKTSDADIIHNFVSKTVDSNIYDKFIYINSLKNGENLTIDNSSISSADSLASAVEKDEDALVYVINSSDQDLSKAVDNFINDHTKVDNLIACSIEALGSMNGLDNAVSDSEKVLLAVNVADAAVVLTFSNTQTDVQNTVIQSEVQLVAVLDDANLTAESFY